MKTLSIAIVLADSLISSGATTTINATNKYAYGATFGWMDWCEKVENGGGTITGLRKTSGYPPDTLISPVRV